ncbi:MAG: transcriptional regulator, IclR family protein [Labilithrix sp.]|nr:transcriptional regulator, IclR family protein [Labilithrix sp.]
MATARLPPTLDEDLGSIDDGEASTRQGIQSVELAMTVLAALEAARGPMPLSEVARRAGWAPSKAHRYLVSLCRIGLASQSPTSGLYDLGPAMRRLGAESLRRTNEVAVASEYAPLLRDVTGHAVNLTVWTDDGPVIVRWDYGGDALPLTVRVGATLPLLMAAAGHVFLAFLPERSTARALATARRLSSLAVADADVERLRDEVRSTGFALSKGGIIPGVSSVAAPVFAAGEQAIPVVLSVVFPQEKASEPELARVRAHLRGTCQRISRELGFVA